MRAAQIAAITALAALPLAAQLRGVFAHPHSNFAQRSLSARSGFGNILFPGTGGPPIVHTPTFADRLGATVSGSRAHLPRRGVFGRPARPIVYPVPVFYGGYWGGYAAPPQQVYVNVQTGPPQPPVIINQYYTPPNAQPVVRDYSGENLPEPGGMRHFHAKVPDRSTAKPVVHNADSDQEDSGGEPTLYLIAYKEGPIYPAIGYWLENGTLHYLTPKGDHNQVSLDLIDMKLTRRLNAERGLSFEIQPE